MELPVDADEAAARAAAAANENVQRFLEGKTVRKVNPRARQARQHRGGLKSWRCRPVSSC